MRRGKRSQLPAEAVFRIPSRGVPVLQPEAQPVPAVHILRPEQELGIPLAFQVAAEGFRKEVEMDRMMGFDGKSLINPRQIAEVHEIYTPTEKEIIFAEKVVREIEEKKAQGIGVFTVDGKMIDVAFYDGAKRTIALAKAAGVYDGDL